MSGIRPADGYKYFEISAPISHGSSGGPIFNSKGEVIGIAVATIEEGQNLNFAVPIDYARGMVTDMGSPKPLAAIYEPRTGESSRECQHAWQCSRSSGGKQSRDLRGDEEIELLVCCLQAFRLDQNAGGRGGLGEPVRDRHAFDQNNNIVGEIYAYADPTRLLREMELSFDSKTQKLTAVYGYPWDFTWTQCKALWGDKSDSY